MFHAMRRNIVGYRALCNLPKARSAPGQDVQWALVLELVKVSEPKSLVCLVLTIIQRCGGYGGETARSPHFWDSDTHRTDIHLLISMAVLVLVLVPI